MTFDNITLQLLMGSVSEPKPAPKEVMEALQEIQIIHNEKEQSGFEIKFDTGRSQRSDMTDLSLLRGSLLMPLETRVVISATFNANQRVIMDGIITKIEYEPSTACSSPLIVTGEDVSVSMDLEEKNVEHPNQSEDIIAKKIIDSYTELGLKAKIKVPPSGNNSSIMANQRNTDLKYLKEMADKFGYVFYITPGPAPKTNTAYWGPPERDAVNKRPLSVNMGQETNVDSIKFGYNALSPTRVKGQIIDRKSNKRVAIEISTSKQQSPLVSEPVLNPKSKVRTELLKPSWPDVMQAQSHAQGIIDDSASNAANASGVLDSLRYGDILMPRGIVVLRGAGYSNDGKWYVNKVTHNIKRGEYKQSFNLTREGEGSTITRV